MAKLVVGVRRLALLAGGAALVLAYALVDGGLSAVELAGIVLALAPPVVLWVLWAALRELAALPERLRTLPDTARGHRDDLLRLLEELRTPGGRLLRVPRALWRLRGAAELVRPYSPLLPFLSPGFLALSALAALAAPLEIALALLVLAARL